jgi:hypothetical protein
MRLIFLPAVLLLLGGCSYSLDDDLLEVRAEISRLEKTVPPESPIWISEGPDRFDLVIEDFTGRVPDYIYDHVLKKLNAMKPEEVDALSRGDFDRARGAADPARYRGKFWCIRGVIGDLRAEDSADPRSPVRRVYSGILFDGRTRPVLFHVIQKPDVLTLREDTVETRAIFVKMIEYTTRSGRRVTAPFFIGKTLRRFL